MVLLDKQSEVRVHTPEVRQARPFWVRQGFWALMVLAAVMGAIVLLAINAEDPTPIINQPATVYEMLPEYNVDTPADPAIAATSGGPVIVVERFVGEDANLDPDPPAGWMPEYEVDSSAVGSNRNVRAVPDLPMHWYGQHRPGQPGVTASRAPDGLAPDC